VYIIDLIDFKRILLFFFWVIVSATSWPYNPVHARYHCTVYIVVYMLYIALLEWE